MENVSGAIEELECRGLRIYVRWKPGKRPADKAQWANHIEDLEVLTIDPRYPNVEPLGNLRGD